MFLTSLFRSLKQCAQARPENGRARPPRRFLPQLTALEDRCLPSSVHAALPGFASHNTAALPSDVHDVNLTEHLAVTNVSITGIISYEGNASHFGHVTTVVSRDNTFIQTAHNGDMAWGYLTPADATTGTMTFTGGTGRYQGISGTASYVSSTDSHSGKTTVDITGTIALAHVQHQPGTHTVSFSVNGGGPAPSGLTVIPGNTAPHSGTGMTSFGAYSGEGQFTLDSLNFSTLAGNFHGYFTFGTANGNLAMNYGVIDPGSFELTPPDANGMVVAQFVAIFTPIPGQCTGQFANVVGGGFVMIATTEPFVLSVNAQGFTPPFNYTWEGQGKLIVATGDN